MRIAIIENNKVINVIMSNTTPVNGVESDTANIGDDYINGEIKPKEIIEKPEIIISKIDCSDIDAIIKGNSIICRKGSLFSFEAKIMKDNSVLPINDAFRMPLRSRDGREKMVLAIFKDGIADINSQIDDSGFWFVNESSINESVPDENQFKFDGITIDSYI